MRLASALLILVATQFMLPGVALAKEQLSRVRLGPYVFDVSMREARAETGQPTDFDVALISGDPTELSLSAVALPALGTAGALTQSSITGIGRDHIVRVRFPTSGTWLLLLRASGRAGSGQAYLDHPVVVSSPGAIPDWLGWAVGLSPLLGLALFAFGQRRYLRRLELQRAAGLTQS